ncbi:MAG: hypothetical protein ACHQVK_02845, partial [Candidatus Paceibacterales bacterium]
KMKNLTLAPMSSHQTKIAGIIITPIALILLLIVKLHGPFMFLSKPAPDRQFSILFAATVFGMYMIAFSKEKNDDERVHMIRAKALQMAFMILMVSLIAMAMAAATGKDDALPGSIFLSSLAALGLGVYLIVFHIGLYFDPAWAYNDDTVIPNIKKNKTFFILYTIGAVIFFALVYLIHRS